MVLKGIILAILCSFVSFLIHLAISFFRQGRLKSEPLIFELIRQTKLLLFIWSFSFLFYVVLFFMPWGQVGVVISKFDTIEVSGFIYGIVLYSILSFIYLSVYYFVNRSISATILEIIDNSTNKKLTQDEIKNIYTTEKKYQKELRGMLEGRFIVKELNYYKNSLKGSLYARMARLVKKHLKLDPGG